MLIQLLHTLAYCFDTRMLRLLLGQLHEGESSKRAEASRDAWVTDVDHTYPYMTGYSRQSTVTPRNRVLRFMMLEISHQATTIESKVESC